MKITIDNYTITVDESSKERFNLSKTVENKEGSKHKEREQSLGYGITLDRAIKIMINDKLSDKNEVMHLESYLSLYLPSIDKLMDRVDKAIKELKTK